MAEAGHLRGHPIICHDGEWYFLDTGEPTRSTWKERPCGHCGQQSTPSGHDACLGELPGVMNACCGHGSTEEAYIQLLSGEILRGRMSYIGGGESGGGGCKIQWHLPNTPAPLHRSGRKATEGDESE